MKFEDLIYSDNRAFTDPEDSFSIHPTHVNAKLLAKPRNYHLSLKNCRYDLGIRTGWNLPTERPGGTRQAVALDDGINVLIISGYVEFSAA